MHSCRWSAFCCFLALKISRMLADHELWVAWVFSTRALWVKMMLRKQGPHFLTLRSSKHTGNQKLTHSLFTLDEEMLAKATTRTVNSHSLPAVWQNAACTWGLFLQVVTGVETRCLWYGFGDTAGWGSVWGEFQRWAVRPQPDHSSSRSQSSYSLNLGLLHLISNMNCGYSGLHSAGLVNTGLGLKVASGLEFQAFIGALWDTGAPAKCLLKTSTKPAEKKHSLPSFRCFLPVHYYGKMGHSPIQRTLYLC